MSQTRGSYLEEMVEQCENMVEAYSELPSPPTSQSQTLPGPWSSFKRWNSNNSNGTPKLLPKKFPTKYGGVKNTFKDRPGNSKVLESFVGVEKEGLSKELYPFLFTDDEEEILRKNLGLIEPLQETVLENVWVTPNHGDAICKARRRAQMLNQSENDCPNPSSFLRELQTIVDEAEGNDGYLEDLEEKLKTLIENMKGSRHLSKEDFDDIIDTYASDNLNKRLPWNLNQALGIDDYRAKLSISLENGLRYLVHSVVNTIFLEHGGLFQNSSRRMVTNAVWEILSSTHSIIIQGLLNGDLYKRYMSNEELKGLLSAMKEKGDRNSSPCIYVISFSDEAGNGPKPDELRGILENMERYSKSNRRDRQDDRFAAQIDAIIHYESSFNVSYRIKAEYKRYCRRGGRKYLTDKVDRQKYQAPLTGRISIVKKFIEAVRRNLDQKRKEGRERYPPLTYVGYTDSPEQRFRTHERHHSTSFVKSFCEAASMVQPGNKYRMRPLVVYSIWKPEHAGIAEIVFTVLSNAMIHHGRGFGIHAAGISNRSVNKVTKDEWDRLKQWKNFWTPFKANQATEKARVNQLKKYVKSTSDMVPILEKVVEYMASDEEDSQSSEQEPADEE